MTNASENSKRIAKNTLLLYVRMLFMMAVSLYTSRVVLNTLGVEDFGIYNVVGGVVAMFGFLNGAMASSTQRYLTFELGRGDMVQLKKVFTTSIYIHGLISLIIIVITESIGLWFLYNKMIIPPERMTAAFWVFQMSILTAVIMIMSVPYNAAIISHEKMGAFAYISVLEALLKLSVVYLLMIGHIDKLILYSILICLVQLLIRFIYGRYCKRHFKECSLIRVWDCLLFKEMISFAGWNMVGNLAGVAYTQGLNLLLNVFFNPVINAARGIAVQVQAAIYNFAFNFLTAVNPQITKSYATNNLSYMHILIYSSSKFTFFLLLLLSLPIMLETQQILTLWLKTAPEYSVSFIRVMLCITIVDSMAYPLMVAADATGRIKLFQSVIGGLLLTVLPFSYAALKLGGSPTSVFVVHLCICIIAYIVRIIFMRSMISLKILEFIKKVILRCVLVGMLSPIIPLIAYYNLPDSISSFFIVCMICILSVGFFVTAVGMTHDERLFVWNKIKRYPIKILNKKNHA